MQVTAELFIFPNLDSRGGYLTILYLPFYHTHICTENMAQSMIYIDKKIFPDVGFNMVLLYCFYMQRVLTYCCSNQFFYGKHNEGAVILVWEIYLVYTLYKNPIIMLMCVHNHT